MELFSKIPFHNQIDVLKKLDFKDFARFKQCSRQTGEITRNSKHKLYLKMDTITLCEFQLLHSSDQVQLAENAFLIRGNYEFYGLGCISKEPILLEITQFSVEAGMSDEQYCFLEEFCQKTKLVAEKLYLYYKEGNGPSLIDHLIKLLKARTLILYRYPSSDIIGLNELKNIKRLVVHISEVDESDLLLLKQPEIGIFPNLLEPSTINKFLKQWNEGKRRIKYFSTVVDRNIEEIFDDLEIFVRWSPESEANVFFDLYEAGMLEIVCIERKMDKKKIFAVVRENRYEYYKVKWIEVGEGEFVEEIRDWDRRDFM